MSHELDRLLGRRGRHHRFVLKMMGVY